MERRIIHTSLVRDDWYRHLKIDEKLLWQHVLINSSRTGIYPISTLEFFIQTGIEEKRIGEILAKFAKENKAHFINGFIIIVNHHRYYSIENTNQAIGIVRDLDALPDSLTQNAKVIPVLENLALKVMAKSCIETLAWLSPNSLETVRKRFANRYETVVKPLRNINTNTNIKTNINSNIKNQTIHTPPSPSSRSKGTHNGVEWKGSVKYHEGPPAPPEECERLNITQWDGCVWLSDTEAAKLTEQYPELNIFDLCADLNDYCKKENIYPTSAYAMLCKFAERKTA